MMKLEIRTVNGDRTVATLDAKVGSYEHDRVCQVIRSCCMKGFLDGIPNKEMLYAMHELRTTFCPVCHLRPRQCRGIE